MRTLEMGQYYYLNPDYRLKNSDGVGVKTIARLTKWDGGVGTFVALSEAGERHVYAWRVESTLREMLDMNKIVTERALKIHRKRAGVAKF